MGRIVTFGYRGPLSEFAYIPSGEWQVGEHTHIADRMIAEPLALHMVAIGNARWVDAPEPVAAPDLVPESAPDPDDSNTPDDGDLGPSKRSARRNRK